jgi:hypothetical protein
MCSELNLVLRITNAHVRPKSPHLLVVEAKGSSPIGKMASLYQLVTQLITVEYHDP